MKSPKKLLVGILCISIIVFQITRVISQVALAAVNISDIRYNNTDINVKELDSEFLNYCEVMKDENDTIGFLVNRESDYVIKSSLANATPLTITAQQTIYRIPTASAIISDGLVYHGIPTYEVVIKYTITGNRDFTNTPINTSISDVIQGAGGGSVVLVSGGATGLQPVSNSGIYTATLTATYHMWNIQSFVSQATIGGGNYSGSKAITINRIVPASYANQYYLTYYIIPKETDYLGNYDTSAAGISGLFKSAFLQAVRLNGTGYTHNGAYLTYNSSSGTYNITTAPRTSSGTIPTAGQTIAVDNRYIPRTNWSGNYEYGKVSIANVGIRYAEDAGGSINNYHIDVFMGLGYPNPEPSWNCTYKNVTYIQNVTSI